MSVVELDGRAVTLSSLEKVLWPETGFTKQALVDYYRRIAPALVPHVAGRPLTLGRFPDGVEGRGFAQSECRGAPEWLETIALTTKAGERRRHCVVEDAASLVWVANQGTIELHVPLGRAPRLDMPTALVLDLDPGPPAGIVECCGVALVVRELLASLGLVALPKTSGASGLHLYIPLNTPHAYDATKAFARSLASTLAAEHPDLVVARATRSIRAGKVLVDWLQNDPTRTTVAPYSLRATRWPTVSTPVTWDEVERARAPAELVFLATDVVDRVARDGDLFGDVLTLEQRLP